MLTKRLRRAYSMTLKFDVRYFDTLGFDAEGFPPQIVAFGFVPGLSYSTFNDLMWVSDLVWEASLVNGF